MWGKLVLTSKRFAFVEQRVVEMGRIRKSRQLETVGIRISMPNEKVLGAHSEVRVRKTGTFSKENYGVLIVSLDTDRGVENPVFEVTDTQGWATAIQRAMGGEVVSTGSGVRTCKYCNAAIGASAAFCPQCGKSQG
jgi:rRNA maturation endonuclease Nob1